jgi:acyl-CoA synthetase (AMP-forming)/AMP-acid ligase II
MEGLYAGTPVYLMERFDVAEVLRLVTTLRCGLLIMIPTMYEVLLDELEQQPGADVACLKYCLYGGEACPQPLAAKIERALGVKPICVYGLTECLPGIGHSREALLGGKIEANSCGTQLFGEIKLVDEHGRESTELGELWVRNGTIPKPVVRGDVNERVTADGWFCTGDLMRRDERGSFFFQGRSDEMFVCNGNNLYPAQVEGMLLDHVDVERVCAAPIKNKLGHTIPAVMVRRRHEVSERDLLRFARLHGPSYAVPAFIRFVDQFPFGSSGKIDRARVATELQRSYDLARHES